MSASEVLDEIELLKLLPDDARRLVLEAFEPVSYRFGELIVEEGAEADGFYVILSGSARALKRGEKGEEISLSTLGPGDTFGEIALIEDGERTATVRASGDVEALRLDRAVFRAVVNV